MAANAARQLFEFVAVSRANALREVRRDIEGLSDATDDYIDAAEQASDTSEKTGGRLAGLANAAKVARTAVAGLAIGGLAVFSAAAGTAFRDFMALDDATNRLAAQTGLTGDELDAAGQSIQQLFAGNWAGTIDDASRALADVRNLTQASGDELEDVTRNALILSNAFGYDVNESVRAVDTAMQRFGADSQHVFDLVTLAAQKTGDPADDLLDTINEYSADFAEAGYSIDTMIETLVAGSDKGIYNLDKMADAVREFGIRTKEGGEESQEAFDKLFEMGADWTFVDYETGARRAIDSTDELMAALADGSVNMALVGDRVAEMWSEIEDPILRNQLGIALMGTQYEELGDAAIEALDIQDEGWQDVEGATEKAGQALQRGVGPAWNRFTRQVRMGLVNAFGPLIERGLNVAVEVLSRLGDWMTTVGIPIFTALGGRVGSLADGFFGLVNSILSSLGLGSDISSMLGNIGSSIKDLFTGSGGLGGIDAGSILDRLFSGLSNIPGVLQQRIIDPVVNWLSGVNWSGIAGRLGAILGSLLAFGAEGVTTYWAWLWERIFNPLITAISEYDWADLPGDLEAILEKLVSGAVTVWDWVNTNLIQPFINGLTGSDWSGAEEGGSKLLAALSAGITGISNIVTGKIIEPVTRWLNSLSWGDLSTAGQSLLNKLVAGLGSMGLWVIRNISGPIATKLQNINWAGVGQAGLNLLSAIGRGLIGVAGWVTDNILTPAINKLTTTNWLGVAQAGLNLLGAVARGLIGVADWVWESVIQPIASWVVAKMSDPATAKSMAMAGGYILEGIGKGLGNAAQWVWEEIIDPILDEIVKLPAEIAAAINGAVNPTSGPNRPGVDFRLQGATQGDTPDTGGGDSLPEKIYDALPGFFKGGKARGGVVGAHEMAIVGERGPELVVPGYTMSVIPNGRSRQLVAGMSAGGGGGGAPTVIIQNLTLENVQSPRELFDALRREAIRRNVPWPGGTL